MVSRCFDRDAMYSSLIIWQFNLFLIFLAPPGGGGDCLFLAMPGKTVFKNYPPVAKVGELAWSKLVTGFYDLNTMTRLF